MFVQVIECRVGAGVCSHGWCRRKPGLALLTAALVLVFFLGFAGVVWQWRRAEANSERAEQGQWWAETEKCFDGAVTFTDSEDVETFLGGGSNDAGFVQVMKGRGVDRDRVRAMDEGFEKHAPSFRPDLIGVLRVWTGPDSYAEVAYFTSEADAREGETKEPPAELAEQMSEFQDLMANIEFLDLKDPWLH